MSIYSQIAGNKRKTLLITAIFIAFISFAAYVFGQAQGEGFSYLGTALIISGFLSLGSYYFGDKIILKISGARPAGEKRDFNFFTVAENLCIGAGLPRPKLYVIEDSAPNAFAAGRDPDHAIICATTGLLNKLERSELEGVIAHELSHIKNYDIRLMAIVAVLVGTTAYLADIFNRSLWWGGKKKKGEKGQVFVLIGVVLAILSPLIAKLIQLSISRQREFLADASAGLLTRNPDALADALEKISQDREVLEAANNATAHLYIINPFKGKEFGAWFAGLFNTHPPVKERIKILRRM
ncbi:M48 family metallopeptidase [Candidatus Microgenomates bacterium]|nr:M48 family metallopeptidase [Candidatus Microgenomates bacterium]